MKSILIINGPNLNMLGHRDPDIYGTRTLDDCLDGVRESLPQGTAVEHFQSNCSGAIIDHIQAQAGRDDLAGIVINPGALAHYDHALADAIADSPHTFVEVHISNIHSRENFRHTSVTAGTCRAMLAGFGTDGYTMAAAYLLTQAAQTHK